ncbi:unnamed protein product [Prunus armeniaca]|uniref:Uncharacterized protein n=1 Tax=Prunus armeniaca TaxID=36596 RepID=A0A6J5U1Z8_PRUAR|nr:unnamed protein product [Prunus armeniaca]
MPLIICVGQHLAMTELKVILAMILLKFRFSLSPAYQNSPAFSLATVPQHGILESDFLICLFQKLKGSMIEALFAKYVPPSLKGRGKDLYGSGKQKKVLMYLSCSSFWAGLSI